MWYFKVSIISSWHILHPHAWLQTHTTVPFRYVLAGITQKLQVVYGPCTHRVTVLLLEVFYFRVGAAYELWLVSYDSKHASQSFWYAILCILTHNLKTTGGISAMYILGDCSPIVLITGAEVNVYWTSYWASISEPYFVKYFFELKIYIQSTLPFIPHSYLNTSQRSVIMKTVLHYSQAHWPLILVNQNDCYATTHVHYKHPSVVQVTFRKLWKWTDYIELWPNKQVLYHCSRRTDWI